MANTPTQHCVHPGRHTSHSPLRRVASARAAATIWISAPSAAGNRREDISEAYRIARSHAEWAESPTRVGRGNRGKPTFGLRTSLEYALINHMRISRRRCLQWLFLICSLVTVTAAKDSQKDKYLLFVGTYTEKESKGIYAYRFDAASSELTPLGLAAETANPSFLAIDPNRRFLYAVNEVPKYKGASSGAVSAFAIDLHNSDRQTGDRQTGKLSLLNEVASRGADPCYIAFDKTGKYALVANYTGGSVAVFPVRADGHIGESSAFVQHAGSSVNKERQEGPHAHWIETTPDNRFAIAVDLGLDELLVYRFDADAKNDPENDAKKKPGSLTANDPPYAKLDPGAGPRHLAFHPNGKFAYV